MNPIVFDSPEQTAAYLRTLPAICERCGSVHELTQKGLLDYFDYHPNKETDAAAFCVSIIKIPPHGRWRHLNAGRPRVQPLIDHWKSSANPLNTKEICRRLIDCFLVSVLLDAGAGNAWSLHESLGLGMASIAMFEQGFFSGDAANPHQVHVSDANPIVGLEGCTSLLVNLSKALKANSTYFGNSAGSVPGTDGAPSRVHIFALWTALIDGLAHASAPSPAAGDDPIPFHKLTGCTTYSLVEPIEKVLGWRSEGLEHMTGLPEYRNERYALAPSWDASFYPDSTSGISKLPPSHPAIIEWHALTVIELYLRPKREKLTLAQVLESAMWKGGREITKQKWPATGGPPIDIDSDGTVF
ncbi:hypothetical protein BD413DRAFT_607139 [Trametes elegans]|nr:hypothetical protein BD413DRAFT_607139 [Trametes elegans]